MVEQSALYLLARTGHRKLYVLITIDTQCYTLLSYYTTLVITPI
ncbi:hypothetical protein ALT1644_250023 [Alteromonas macleodii]